MDVNSQIPMEENAFVLKSLRELQVSKRRLSCVPFELNPPKLFLYTAVGSRSVI